MRLSSSSRYLLNLPLNHVSGLSIVFRSFFCGSTLILKKPQELFSSFILKEKISHLSVVAAQLQSWVREPCLSQMNHLKCVLLGGGPTSEALITAALEKNIPLYQSYGMTESCSTITLKKLNLSSSYTCGKPLLYRNLNIPKSNSIAISGKTLCLGYFNTSSMQITSLKVLNTKDIGMYKQKELIVLGRKDNMLIFKGENIFPEEIEQKLSTHCEIDKACLVAVSLKDNDIKLVVYLKTKKNHIPSDIKEFCKTKLPSIKRPHHFFLWPELEDNKTAKISKALRKNLQELALSKILENS